MHAILLHADGHVIDDDLKWDAAAALKSLS